MEILEAKFQNNKLETILNDISSINLNHAVDFFIADVEIQQQYSNHFLFITIFNGSVYHIFVQ